MMYAPTQADVDLAESDIAPGSMRYRTKAQEQEEAKGSIVIDPSRATDAPVVRIPTGLRGFDFVLNGGLALAKTIVLTGKPGAGKSRLMLGVMKHISEEHASMFVAGEMGDGTVQTAKEMGAVRRGRLHIVDTDDLSKALHECSRKKAKLVVIDSLHRVTIGHGDPGSPTQIRAVMRECRVFAREEEACVFLLAHATKAGEFKGDSAGEHDPDATLRMRLTADPYRQLVCDKTRLGGARGKRAWLQFDSRGRLCDSDRQVAKKTAGETAASQP